MKLREFVRARGAKIDEEVLARGLLITITAP